MAASTYTISEPGKTHGYDMRVQHAALPTLHPGSHTIEIDLDNPPPLTPGEKWFDVLDWFGLGWGVNAGVGMLLADKITYGSGQPFLGWFTKQWKKIPAIKQTGKAGTMANISTLLLGGYAIMAPVKWIEDNKQDIVSWLDRGYESKNITMQRKADIEARHEYLKHEPKQSWGSIIAGRTASVGSILAFHFSIAGKENVPNYLLHPMGKNFKGFDAWSNGYIKNFRNFLKEKSPAMRNFFDRAERRMELTPKFHYEEYVNKHPDAKVKNVPFTFRAKGKTHYDKEHNPLMSTGEARVHTWMYNINIEALYTFFVAGFTYVFSKGFAALFEKKAPQEERQLVIEKTHCPEGVTYTKAQYNALQQQAAQMVSEPLAQENIAQDAPADNGTAQEAEAPAAIVTPNAVIAKMHAVEAEKQAAKKAATALKENARKDDAAVSTHEEDTHLFDVKRTEQPPSLNSDRKDAPDVNDAPSAKVASIAHESRQEERAATMQEVSA